MENLFENSFFWAQIIGFIALGFCILAWQLKNSYHIMALSMLECALWGIHYIAMGMTVAGIQQFIASAKCGIVAYASQKYLKAVITIYVVCIWANSLFLFSHWHDLIPAIASSIISIPCIRADSREIIARGMFCGQLMWIYYDLYIGSVIAAFSSFIIMVSVIIGMYRHENWQIGKCHKTFVPSIARALFVFPNFRTFP